MSKFCTNCGKEICDRDAFCSDCGTKAILEDTPPEAPHDTPPPADTATVPVDLAEEPEECSANQAPPVQAAPPCASQSTVSATPPAEDPSCKVVGVGTFWGLEFLFSIPLIGLILCIIMTITPKNKNLKNFARAKLIWIIISTLLFIWIVFTLCIFGSMVITYFEKYLTPWLSEFDIKFDSLTELTDSLNELLSQFNY